MVKYSGSCWAGTACGSTGGGGGGGGGGAAPASRWSGSCASRLLKSSVGGAGAAGGGAGSSETSGATTTPPWASVVGTTGAAVPGVTWSEIPGITAAYWNRLVFASKLSTPYCDPRASIVLPSPRLIATCCCTGRPVFGSGLNENSSAPGVWMAWSPGSTMPRSCRYVYWSQALRGTSTPAWCADHCTSIEQSNAFGFGSSSRSITPKMY